MNNSQKLSTKVIDSNKHTTDVNIAIKSNLQNTRLQSVLNNVFTNLPENDSDFNNKSKRNHSSTSSDTSIDKSKKNKPIFASSNRYAILINNDEINQESEHIGTNHTNIDIDINAENEQIKPPPPIFIRGILDFFAFHTNLIQLVPTILSLNRMQIN